MMAEPMVYKMSEFVSLLARIHTRRLKLFTPISLPLYSGLSDLPYHLRLPPHNLIKILKAKLPSYETRTHPLAPRAAPHRDTMLP